MRSCTSREDSRCRNRPADRCLYPYPRPVIASSGSQRRCMRTIPGPRSQGRHPSLGTVTPISMVRRDRTTVISRSAYRRPRPGHLWTARPPLPRHINSSNGRPRRRPNALRAPRPREHRFLITMETIILRLVPSPESLHYSTGISRVLRRVYLTVQVYPNRSSKCKSIPE
jgi:hypothetical protein